MRAGLPGGLVRAHGAPADLGAENRHCGRHHPEMAFDLTMGAHMPPCSPDPRLLNLISEVLPGLVLLAGSSPGSGLSSTWFL